MLAAFPVYRAYLPAGADHVADAVFTATERRPELAPEFRTIAAHLAASPEGEFTRRFMQLTGPVMAKGIEDTAFYRWLRLAGANEVGGHPQTLSISADDFHAYASRQLEHWPLTMTTLTTHDTKRSEDVRARLDVLASYAEEWGEVLHRLRSATAADRATSSATTTWNTWRNCWPPRRSMRPSWSPSRASIRWTATSPTSPGPSPWPGSTAP